ERPVRSSEFLRGRMQDLDEIVTELRYFHAIPFIYGHRGVGKTSLARTAAQLANPSGSEHNYVACASGSRILHVFREIGEELLKLLSSERDNKVADIELPENQAIRASLRKHPPALDAFSDVNAAIRVLKTLDRLL